MNAWGSSCREWAMLRQSLRTCFTSGLVPELLLLLLTIHPSIQATLCLSLSSMCCPPSITTATFPAHIYVPPTAASHSWASLWPQHCTVWLTAVCYCTVSSTTRFNTNYICLTSLASLSPAPSLLLVSERESPPQTIFITIISIYFSFSLVVPLHQQASGDHHSAINGDARSTQRHCKRCWNKWTPNRRSPNKRSYNTNSHARVQRAKNQRRGTGDRDPNPSIGSCIF